ncbi:MAG: flagellar basal-body rod modification protein FlgD [Alphaproteobacteria bacterium]|jgi:flagellar basal-body rod modification protein FlgD
MALDPIDYFSDNSAYIDSVNKSNDKEVKGDGTASAAADMNFETFMTLLVTQLQNQDPLEPMDNQQMTAQLAQFSSLEQNITQNEHLAKIAGQADYSQQGVALSYVGKDALVPGAITASNGTNDVSLNYKVEDTVTNVSVEILNGDGEVVRTMEGGIAQGRNEAIWDSKDDAGNAVEAGFYSFRVSGVDPNGEDVNVEEFSYGHVNSLEGDGESIRFTATDGRTFSLDDILLVREAIIVPVSNASAGTPADDTTEGDSESSTEDEFAS